MSGILSAAMSAVLPVAVDVAASTLDHLDKF
jgi:hypothetical protein